ncbi:hypothetical protein U0070_010177 [Myodes glareolus]|uniref:Uncharacterized protein n=1 Tax=Myodes glareolus TaxID=447135 RepID=A0AAW0HF32_MYOGA
MQSHDFEDSLLQFHGNMHHVPISPLSQLRGLMVCIKTSCIREIQDFSPTNPSTLKQTDVLPVAVESVAPTHQEETCQSDGNPQQPANPAVSRVSVPQCQLHSAEKVTFKESKTNQVLI